MCKTGVSLLLLVLCLVAGCHLTNAAKPAIAAVDNVPLDYKVSISSILQIYNMCRQIHNDEMKLTSKMDKGVVGEDATNHISNVLLIVFIFLTFLLCILSATLAIVLGIKSAKASHYGNVLDRTKMVCVSHINAHPLLHYVDMEAFNYWWHYLDDVDSTIENPREIPFDKFILDTKATPIPINSTMSSAFYCLLMQVLDDIQRKEDDKLRTSTSTPTIYPSKCVKQQLE